MKLIDDWAHHWLRMASTRLAMIAGFIAAYFVANPAELQAMINTIPDAARPFAAPLIGMMVTGAASAARMVQFKEPKKP